MSGTLLGNRERANKTGIVNGALGQVGKTDIEHKIIRHHNKGEVEGATGVFNKGMSCSLLGSGMSGKASLRK